jgi:demethylmenaquinone methyltransferase/2-methoxy-6-polyprenyl-1,4-benzoquinol methylase
MIPALGAAIAQDRQSYQYLVESIRTFPSPNALQTRMITSGFTKVSYVKMTAGVVAIHTGFKK